MDTYMPDAWDLNAPGPAFAAFQAFITRKAYDEMDHSEMDWERAMPEWMTINYLQYFGHKRFQAPQPFLPGFEDFPGPPDPFLQLPSGFDWLWQMGNATPHSPPQSPPHSPRQPTSPPSQPLPLASEDFSGAPDAFLQPPPSFNWLELMGSATPQPPPQPTTPLPPPTTAPAPVEDEFDVDAAWAEFEEDEKKRKEKGKTKAQDEFGDDDNLPAVDDPIFDEDMEAAWAVFEAGKEEQKKKKEEEKGKGKEKV